jgi:hypothetical protein
MTRQVLDQLSYRGRDRRLRESPLQPYLDAHPELRARLEPLDSSVWRGYRASWEVRGGRLYLIDLTAWMRAADGSITEHGIDALFADAPPPVFASWFSGTLEFDDAETPAAISLRGGTILPA